MIDAIDRKILHHVQRDNLLTSARLSELVGLSQTSVPVSYTHLTLPTSDLV